MSMLAAMRDSSEPQSLIACQALILILVPLDQKPTTQYRYGMESCDSSVQHTMYYVSGDAQDGLMRNLLHSESSYSVLQPESGQGGVFVPIVLSPSIG